MSILPLTGSAAAPPHADVLEKLRAVYEPVIQAQGGQLQIVQREPDAPFYGFAAREGEKGERWIVGIAGHADAIPVDAFRFAVCHEMGHLLGGAPRRPIPPEWDGPSDSDGLSLLSSEGESDYFATFKCMREMLASEDNLAAVAAMTIDPVVARSCDQQFADRAASALCKRSAMSGVVFFQSTLASAIAFSTPSAEVATRTINDSYPSRQCRLDTVFAGALCTVDAKVPMDRLDPKVGACSGTRVGARPRCWFVEAP